MNFFRSKLMGLALLTAAVSFVACDDDVETSSLVLDQTQEAIVTAYLYAELDKTELGLEYATNGTKVIVSVDNSEFNPNAKGTWIDTVYVQNGQIESVVPVTSQGVTVRITPAEFELEQKQAYNSVSETLKKIFKKTGGSTVGGVKPGEHRYHEIEYEADDFKNLAEYVNRRFTVKAIVNVEDGEKEVAGAEITFYNDDWSTTVRSDEGIVDVDLPKGEETTAVFTYNKKWEADNNNRKTYRYTAEVDGYPETSPVLVDLSFGEGTLYE